MSANRSEYQGTPSPPGEAVKILVVGGKGIFQQALVDLISQQANLTVCLMVPDLLEAYTWLKRDLPRVVILDWPALAQGSEAIIEELVKTRPRLRWVAVSLYDDPFSVKQVFGLGMHGYVTKAMAADTICQAVHRVNAGGIFCSPDVIDVLPDSSQNKIDP